MNCRLTACDWDSFQHYKDRNPPWIRLHKSLLDNYVFQRLPVDSRALAPMLWLLASEAKDPKSGVIHMSTDEISFRLRISKKELIEALKPLVQAGFFLLESDDSDLLAACQRVAVPETETETETETDKPNPPLPPRKRGGSVQEGFELFWQAWPASPRKVAKAKCAEKWARLKLEPACVSIIKHVEAMKATQQWKDGYEPAPLTYINQRRWCDDVPVSRKANGNGGAWWSDIRSMQAKARELGLSYPEGRTGETEKEFRARIQAEIDKQG